MVFKRIFQQFQIYTKLKKIRTFRLFFNKINARFRLASHLLLHTNSKFFFKSSLTAIKNKNQKALKFFRTTVFYPYPCG